MNALVSTKPTILIVDDSRVVVKILTRMLREEYEILTAANGQDALELIQERREIKLVVSDLWMPVVDGFELLTCIKRSSNPDINRIPVVIVSASKFDNSVREKLEVLGVAAIVKKPVTTEKLADVLTEVESNEAYSHGALHLLQTQQANLFPVLSGSEIRAHLRQFFDIEQPEGAVNCLLMFKVKEQSFTGVKSTAEISSRVFDTLSNGIRETDCFLRYADQGFLLVMSGVKKDIIKRRAHQLLVTLSARMAENQPPFNKYFIHMCVAPYAPEEMNDAAMWQVFADAHDLIKKCRNRSKNVMLYEHERHSYSTSDLIRG